MTVRTNYYAHSEAQQERPDIRIPERGAPGNRECCKLRVVRAVRRLPFVSNLEQFSVPEKMPSFLALLTAFVPVRENSRVDALLRALHRFSNERSRLDPVFQQVLSLKTKMSRSVETDHCNQQKQAACNARCSR